MSWRHTHQQLVDLGAQLVKRTFDSGGTGADQQQAVAQRGTAKGFVEDVAEATAQPITRDRWADRPSHGEGHPGRHGRDIVDVSTPQGRRRGATTMAGQRLELSPLVDPTDQADRRLRPLSRRALMMARPERVRMRARKPCLRARRRLFGWKVRFTAGSGHDGRTCRHGAVVAGGWHSDRGAACRSAQATAATAPQATFPTPPRRVPSLTPDRRRPLRRCRVRDEPVTKRLGSVLASVIHDSGLCPQFVDNRVWIWPSSGCRRCR